MIVRPQTAPKIHAITAYDFEWSKSAYRPEVTKSGASRLSAKLELTLAGAYDERGYRAYRTLEDFCQGEFTTASSGRRFYAHFGGASDMVFLIRVLARRKDRRIRAIFSGSSAIVVSIEDRYGRRWTLLDSFWTMRVPLAAIGEWLGFPKLEFDHTREHSWAELREYNERDCAVLHRALLSFQETINDLGAELRVTGASTALDLFLRRYLVRPVRNSERINDYVRPAYQASRVEPLQSRCDAARVYDINSSFPYSMTFPLPGDPLGAFMRQGRPSLPDSESALWVADCTVRVEEQYLPPLPYRGEKTGRVYFPTGEFRARLTSEDMRCGDFQVLKVHSCETFEPRLDMAAFAEELFARRQGGGFQSQCYKILSNSLYGKWGEQEDKEILLINPESVTQDLEPLAPGIFLGSERITVEHAHVPFSAFITARSRRILREYALDAYRQTGAIYYLDTDSVFTTATLPESKALGGLKLEAEISRGAFHGPKLYAYTKLDGRELVKAKGFSRVVSSPKVAETTRLTYEDFVSLKESGAVAIERMRRIKELVRANKGFDFDPDVLVSDKRLGRPHPKRKTHGTDSVPWDASELVGC